MPYVIVLTISYLLMLVDCSVLPSLNLLGIVPSLSLAWSIGVGMSTRPFIGAVSGLLVGVCMDLMFGPVRGMYAFIYLLIPYLLSVLHQQYFRENILFAGIIIACGYLCKEGIAWIIARLMGVQTESILLMFLRFLLPCAIITGGIGIGLYLIARKFSDLRLFERLRSDE